MNQNYITVNQLTKQIKTLLEQNFQYIYVIGEISNYKAHSSGHSYFTLKDEQSQIRCAIWRYKKEKIRYRLEDGLKVKIFGKISLYERTGTYQIIIENIEPEGIGDLQLAFEQLKNKLLQEGLFDQRHKKQLPGYPTRIGVVTSPTGAAIRDIINITRRRNAGVEIILSPVKVQGPGAAQEIAKAIRQFNEYGKIDLLIVGRGGGSLEDLWPFNEEVVARAIFESVLPVISSVGHEIDFTISDFAADLRAPTPSAAAELAVPDTESLKQQILHYNNRILMVLGNRFKFYKERTQQLKSKISYEKFLDQLHQNSQYIDQLSSMMRTHLNYNISQKKEKISFLIKHLNNLNPKSILERGYSITQSLDTDQVVLSAQKLQKGSKIKTIFHQGAAISQIIETEPNQ